MDIIYFTIYGMPVSYKRLSRDDNFLKVLPESKVGDALIDKWRKIQAYIDWKKNVAEIARQYGVNPKTRGKVYLHINFYFSNKKHGDLYNYWLNIADSIFDKKKYVVGSFEVTYSETDKSDCIVSEKSLASNLFESIGSQVKEPL